jgi:hypothetical protein
MAEPRTTPPTQMQPPPQPAPRRSELQPSTLLIAAAASAVAAFVTSQVWPGGALWSSAAFPVIVALVKEALNRPAEKVRAVRVDRFGRQQAITLPQDVADQMEEGAPPPVYGPVTVHGRRRRWWPKRWRLAIVTGLLGFAIVAIAFTVPELVAGKSLNGRDRTTMWGGRPSRSQHESGSSTQATPTATAAPGTTPTATPTATPQATPTATPSATPQATPTVAPSATPSPAPTP